MGTVAFSYNKYITMDHIKKLESVRGNRYAYTFYSSVRLVASKCRDCGEIHLILSDYYDGDNYFFFKEQCDTCGSELITYQTFGDSVTTKLLQNKYGEPNPQPIDLNKIGSELLKQDNNEEEN